VPAPARHRDGMVSEHIEQIVRTGTTDSVTMNGPPTVLMTYGAPRPARSYDAVDARRARRAQAAVASKGVSQPALVRRLGRGAGRRTTRTAQIHRQAADSRRCRTRRSAAGAGWGVEQHYPVDRLVLARPRLAG